MDTKAVLEHHLAALGNGDVEEILKDYTEESILLTADGTYNGKIATQTFAAKIDPK